MQINGLGFIIAAPVGQLKKQHPLRWMLRNSRINIGIVIQLTRRKIYKP